MITENKVRVRRVGEYLIVFGRAGGRGVCTYTGTVHEAETVRNAYMAVRTREDYERASRVAQRVSP